jgi:hypothetical protein
MEHEQGKILSDKPMRSELALVSRAARERWPIPEQMRHDLVDKLTPMKNLEPSPATFDVRKNSFSLARARFASV